MTALRASPVAGLTPIVDFKGAKGRHVIAPTVRSGLRSPKETNEARRADMLMPVLRTSSSFLTAYHDLTVVAIS